MLACMTEEEIDALLAPEEDEPPASDRREARVKAADEVLAWAARLADEGKPISAFETAKLADMIARAAKRIGDLEESALGASLAKFVHGQGLAKSGQAHINIGPAKDNLSRLVAMAARGEEIILCRAGQPVARIAPLREAQDIIPSPAIAGEG
jgi:hypothetical protein